MKNLALVSLFCCTVFALVITDVSAQIRPHIRRLPRSAFNKPYPALDSAGRAAILEAHNVRRRAAGLTPLEWSAGLSAYAQEWANYLATHGCAMKHRPSDGEFKQRFGENLYIATLYAYTPSDGVNDWYAEKKLYDGSPIDPQKFHPYGHYTQMMWHSTTHVGAGIAVCGNMFILVCNYDPAGNVVGQLPY